jgi:hypothetical protein
MSSEEHSNDPSEEHSNDPRARWDIKREQGLPSACHLEDEPAMGFGQELNDRQYQSSAQK